MRLAKTADGRLIEATRAESGRCPGCASELVAKLGTIVGHHWAHRAGPDCDAWSEPESEWHLSWKHHAPPERTEVVMGAAREHRADVVLPDGRVLELQALALSAEAIAEREAFYTAHAGGMIWLWDASRFWSAARLRTGSDDRLFLRRHRTLLLPRAPMYWDIPPNNMVDPAFAAMDFSCACALGLVDMDAAEHRYAAAERRLFESRSREVVREWRAALDLCNAGRRQKAALGNLLLSMTTHGGILRMTPTYEYFTPDEFLTREQFAAMIRGNQ